MIHPHIAALLSHPGIRAAIERALAARGQHGDTEIAHVSPDEMNMLKQAGGVGTRNPATGLPQFYAIGGDGGQGAYGRGSAGSGNLGHASYGGGGTVSRDPRGGIGGNNAGDRGTGALYRWYQLADQLNQPQVQQPAVVPTPPPPPPAPPPPVATAPMMSTTANRDLTHGQFGALPVWATTPYQVGTAPTSFPVPYMPSQPPPQLYGGQSGMVQGGGGGGLQGVLGGQAGMPQQQPMSPQDRWKAELLQRLMAQGWKPGM